MSVPRGLYNAVYYVDFTYLAITMYVLLAAAFVYTWRSASAKTNPVMRRITLVLSLTGLFATFVADVEMMHFDMNYYTYSLAFAVTVDDVTVAPRLSLAAVIMLGIVLAISVTLTVILCLSKASRSYRSYNQPDYATIVVGSIAGVTAAVGMFAYAIAFRFPFGDWFGDNAYAVYDYARLFAMLAVVVLIVAYIRAAFLHYGSLQFLAGTYAGRQEAVQNSAPVNANAPQTSGS